MRKEAPKMGMDFVINGLALLLAPNVLLVICICSLYGLVIGSVPGLSAVLGGLTIIVWFFPVLATFLEKAKKRNQHLVQ